MLRKLTDILAEGEKNKPHKKDKVKNLLNGQNLILFFTKDNNVFGAPEESRIVFSKMKSNDEDLDGIEGARFSGLNLLQALTGNMQNALFSHNDLPHIQVIDQDEVEKRLMQSDCEKV